jgi:hypothetical protein
VQVRYRGFFAPPELRDSVQDEARSLARPGVERCVVGVERWHCHHGQGSYYRVTVEADVAGEELKVAEESELATAPAALDAVLHDAFSVAQAEITRALDREHPSKALKHSAETRRLHPLHGLTAEDDVTFKELTRGWE